MADLKSMSSRRGGSVTGHSKRALKVTHADVREDVEAGKVKWLLRDGGPEEA